MKKSYSEYKFVQNIYNLQESIKPFIKNIIYDSYEFVDDIYYKIGLDKEIYKIGIFNKRTGITVIKNYTILEFLEIFADKNKAELKMNMLVKEMLLKTETASDTKIINM